VQDGQAKPQLSARAQRFQELDRIAYDMGPNMDDIKLFSLRFEEMSYVLSMAHLYMLARMGAVSAAKGAELKRKYILRTDKIHNELINARYMYHKELVNTLTYSKNMNQLTELINKGSAEALPKALEIIDHLSGSYIFTKLYYNAVKGGDYEAAIAEVTSEPDRQAELKSAFERLLSEITNDRLPSTFEELTDEELKVLASRIPQKEIIGSNIPDELLLKP
jgi:hypothetical protein